MGRINVRCSADCGWGRDGVPEERCPDECPACGADVWDNEDTYRPEDPRRWGPTWDQMRSEDDRRATGNPRNLVQDWYEDSDYS